MTAYCIVILLSSVCTLLKQVCHESMLKLYTHCECICVIHTDTRVKVTEVRPFNGYKALTVEFIFTGLNNSIKYLEEKGLSLHNYTYNADFIDAFMRGIRDVSFLGVSVSIIRNTARASLSQVTNTAHASLSQVTKTARASLSQVTTLHIHSFLK